MKKGYKLFTLTKYVKARNAPEALRLAKKIDFDDVYVSTDWKEGKIKEMAQAVGFITDTSNDDES